MDRYDVLRFARYCKTELEKAQKTVTGTNGGEYIKLHLETAKLTAEVLNELMDIIVEDSNG